MGSPSPVLSFPSFPHTVTTQGPFSLRLYQETWGYSCSWPPRWSFSRSINFLNSVALRLKPTDGEVEKEKRTKQKKKMKITPTPLACCVTFYMSATSRNTGVFLTFCWLRCWLWLALEKTRRKMVLSFLCRSLLLSFEFPLPKWLFFLAFQIPQSCSCFFDIIHRVMCVLKIVYFQIYMHIFAC